ncbi:MAG: DUF4335 domain-containing protein [Cyanobacteria bacterium P01_A01_bin.137]
MTIQRQYVLPNCSLILEGLSTEDFNVLSVLANAEFKIIGVEKSLEGGSEFFKALIVAVSAYCQRLLSGLEHPEHMDSQSSLVAVEPDEGQYHRLILKPEILSEPSDDSSEKSSEVKTIQLSTVQLFDMAEAIDQFYADAQTLPDFSVNLAPLPRKYVRAAEPLVQRAIPPLLGFGTLAVAALGLFFLPVPELVEPEGLEPQDVLEEPLTEPLEEGPAGSVDNEVEVPPTDDTDGSAGASPITDSAQLGALQQQVQQQIVGALPDDAAFEQPLSYQVSVAQNGDIVAYNPLDSASLENLDSTPLPALTYIPTEGAIAESVAQFEVTFAPDGTVEVVSDQLVAPETVAPETVAPETATPEVILPETVSPDAIAPETETPNPEEDLPAEESNDDAPEQSSQPPSGEATNDLTAAAGAPDQLVTSVVIPIRDVDRIYELNQELRRTIISNRTPNWSGPELRYRVRLDDDGNITGYAADTTAANQYANDFKLPSLVKEAPTEKPQLDFLVVINDASVVEVNPWDGWP